jgi:aminopeptidase N
MENTSATLHGDFMIYQTQEDREIQGESVISHELFHQWFGDLVTCESWSHLPLNESFATYGEYLWQEHKYGRDAADLHQRESRNNYFGTYSNGDDRSPINFYYQNREKMFDAISYNKGGLILHSLRKTLGDSVFFKGLNLYLNRHAYKTVEIHDLRLALEEVSGTDLNWFFNQWFLSPGLALMSVQKRYDAEQKMLVLECTQLQENPLALILPLDIDVYAGGKINRERIWMRKRHEIFQISCSSPPDWVNVDAENQIVGYIYPYTLETENVFAFQNAPLAEDRIDAALAISSQIDQPDIRNLFLNAAENDPSKDLRLLCWELLAPDSLIESDKLPKSLLPKLKSVLKKENDAAIRAYLSKMQLHLINDPIDVITECYTQLKDTSTYWIGYYAFNYLNTHNVSSKELLVATRALTWQNETMVSLKLNVLSELGDSTDIPYFLSLLKKPGMYDLKNWIQMPYIKFANRIKNPQMFYEYTRALFPFFKYLKNTSMDAKTLESYQNTIDSVYSNTKSNFEIYKAQNNLNANLKLQLEYAEKLKALFDGL